MKFNTNWLRLTGTVILLGWIIYILDWQELLRQLSRVSLSLFLIALLINAVATIGARSMLVWSLLEKSSRPPLSRVIETFFSLRFFSIALPKPLVVGMRISRLNKLFGKNVYFAIGLMSYEALTGALVMSLGAVCFYLIQAEAIAFSPATLFVLLSALALLCLYVVLFTGKLDFLVLLALNLLVFKTSLRENLESRLNTWRNWVGEHIANERSALAATIGFALVFYIGFIISAYVLFMAMGESLSFSAIAWARSAVWLLLLIPISIGGLGVREAGLAYVLADFGVAFELAVAYGILSFILQTSIGLLGAGIELKNTVVRK